MLTCRKRRIISEVIDRVRDRGWQRLTVAGLALYATFLVTAPFEHHDLRCELKTPLHCSACTSSLVGSDPHAPSILTTRPLADLGLAFALQPLVEGILLPVRSTGRSPPAHA